MPQPKKYRSHADRQAAYLRRQRQAQERLLGERGLPPSPAIPTLPGRARWSAAICKATALLELVKEEMQTYADDRSEAWQESDRADAHQEKIAAIEEVLDAIAQVPA